MLSINPRSSWSARTPTSLIYASLDQGIVFHWNGPPLGAYSEPSDIIYGTQGFHMNIKGWSDIAYNYAIDRFGTVHEGRGLDIRNAASGTDWSNSSLLAVELLMGDGDIFDERFKSAMIKIAKWYTITLGRVATFYGHRDIVATDCPGNAIYSFIQQLPSLLVLPEEEEDMDKLVESDNGTIYIVSGATKSEVIPAGNWTDTSWALAQLVEAGLVKDFTLDNLGSRVKVPQGALDRIPTTPVGLSATEVALEILRRIPQNSPTITINQVETAVRAALNATRLSA